MSKSEREELLRNAMAVISRRELSLRLHVSPAALDEWISGKAPIPDGTMFVLLAVLNDVTRRRRFTDAVKDDSSLCHQATKNVPKLQNQGTNSSELY
jgi:hypothetical protein